MTAVTVWWALVGKRPGAYDDYALLASTKDPVRAETFEKLVFESSPGNSPPRYQSGISGLPWVWFMPFTIRGTTTYVSVAIREWTDHVDATNRPIAFTRYFCVSLDEFVAAGLTFTSLYQAVRDVPLSWEKTKEGHGEPLEISVPEQPASWQGTIGFDLAATVAAGLFERSAVLLRGDVDLLDRLAVLDAVSSLMPAGAKAWLAASVWADPGAKGKLRLTFADRPRQGDLAVDLSTGQITATDLSQNCVRYWRTLTELARRYGETRVVEHLSQLGEVRKQQDASAAEQALADLDLPALIVLSARDGTLTPALVRRLPKRHDFATLAPTERTEVAIAYLKVATLADLITDKDLFERLCASPMDAKITDVLVRLVRAQRGNATADQLITVAAIARTADDMARFGAAINPQHGDNGQQPVFARTAAATVLRLVADPEWAEVLAPMAANSAPLVTAMLNRHSSGHGELTKDWLDRLDALGPQTPWAQLSTLYRSAQAGEIDAMEPAKLDQLDQADPNSIGNLLAAAIAHGPAKLAEFLGSALPWLRGKLVQRGLPPWVEQLASLRSGDITAQAEIDFVLGCSGRKPQQNHMMIPEYRKQLLLIARQTELSDQQRFNLVEMLARSLGPGWSDPNGFGDILETFWQLTQPANAQPVSSQSFLMTLAEEIRRNPGRLAVVPELERWFDQLRRLPGLGQLINMTQLRKLRADDDPTQVALLICYAHRAGAGARDIADALTASPRWQPSPAQWCECLTVLTSREFQAQARDPAALGREITNSLIARGLLGGDQSLAAEQLLMALLHQAHMAFGIMQQAARRDWINSRSVDMVDGVRQRLGDLVKETDREFKSWQRLTKRKADDGDYFSR